MIKFLFTSSTFFDGFCLAEERKGEDHNSYQYVTDITVGF